MTEELATLWALRGLDDQLAQSRDALGQIPGRRREIETRLTAERSRLEELKNHLVALQRSRREQEQEIQSFTQQEQKFKSQLNLVKKNEEYAALLHEIDAVKARRGDVETDVLLKMEEEEKAEHERSDVERTLAAAEREAEARRREIDNDERERQNVVDRLEGERATLMERLSPSTRQRYGRIHHSRGGRAVVPIQKDACGGCFRSLPPQLLMEARRGDRLLSCEGCGRLLVWPPGEG